MQNNKTTSMVEAGILSAVAVLFAVIGLYLPIAGAFMNILWPVPTILLGVRHGLKWSALCLLTAGAIVAIVVNPLQSVMLVVGLGPIGIVVGWALRRGMTPMRTLFWGSIASFCSKVAILAITFFVLGIDPIDFSPEKINAAIEQVLNMMKQIGLPAQILEEQKALLTAALAMVKIILPAGFVAGSIFDTFLNFLAARAILRRLGTYIEDLPPFREWALPPVILFVYGAALILFSFFQHQPDSLGYNAAMNAQVLASLPLLLQGFSIIWFFVYKFNWPNLVKGFAVALFFSIPIMPLLIIMLGLMDFIFDFRKIRPPRR